MRVEDVAAAAEVFKMPHSRIVWLLLGDRKGLDAGPENFASEIRWLGGDAVMKLAGGGGVR